MIPAHAFGGSAYRVGGRGAFSAHRAWIVVSPDPAPDTGRDLEGAETVRAVLEAPPPDARHSTAGELGATLAPVVGAHCSTCEGLLWRRCTADAGRRVAVLRAGLLVVDIGGWRYALAPMVPHDSDDVVEVTL